MPLAIELAAARVRLLTPATLLDRLDRQLALLVGGQRSLPPRQQAVRSTIDWSTRLLDAPERDLLWRLGIFAGRFSLEAVEALAGDSAGDVLMLLEALVDSSLVRQQDRSGRTYFALLATVREYALEKLDAAGLLGEVRDLHTRYFTELARHAARDLAGPRQAECVAELADERDNLRATARHLLDIHDWEAAADFSWCLYTYWWLGGLLGEVRGWMDELLAAEAPLSDRTRAIALYFTCAIGFWQEPAPQIVPGLTESAELFRRVGSPSEEALTLISLALAHLTGAAPDVPAAAAALDRSLQLFRQAGDQWGKAWPWSRADGSPCSPRTRMPRSPTSPQRTGSPKGGRTASASASRSTTWAGRSCCAGTSRPRRPRTSARCGCRSRSATTTASPTAWRGSSGWLR
ncbi:ATP-binding protein [Naasia aerilata]|uniref:Winged helix-turn-helix domain-containing protein n=1 Tax=Naasia aerilata TaxID=1162966 RepID=A0ABN6XMF1_9MICO|nr:hypothetical protein [Naasia aerilata]BDZ46056.1 hypothetical protein GCM10025866_19650 [Naasia aerilata]